MKAMVLSRPAPAESRPLVASDVPEPEPVDDEVIVKVHACGVCRTDLHVIEGELPLSHAGIIPGHQVVGEVVRAGKAARRFARGDRVGVPWLHRTDGTCEWCRRGRENLCPNATFTGYTAQGGYAEFVSAPEAFVYSIPAGFDDLKAAPLLCAGIIGFRCLRMAGLEPGGDRGRDRDEARGDSLGIYGFGAAGHVCIQVAQYWGMRVFVATRDERHRRLARELGAEWVGEAYATPPEKLNAAIIFAPAGELVPAALAALKPAGTLVLGGIHMSPIPSFDYDLLYRERVVRSVANNTRQDGVEFLKLAAEIPIHTHVQTFPLAEANEALIKLKTDALQGAAVLSVE
jgi:alcohol dehydrogenase, propanol-preferring